MRVNWRLDDWLSPLGSATVSRVGPFRGPRSVASGGHPHPCAESNQPGPERLTGPLSSGLTWSCTEKVEHALVRKKVYEDALCYGSDCSLVVQKPSHVLAGVNVSCSGNQTTQNECSLRTAVKRLRLLKCRVSCDPNGVLGAQRCSADRNQQNPCKYSHPYLRVVSCVGDEDAL